MAKTVIERVSGELADAGTGKSYSVQLDLTVKELAVDELTQPVARAVARCHLVSARGIEDGEYTLRYSFDGKPQVQSVRVQYGQLLAGILR